MKLNMQALETYVSAHVASAEETVKAEFGRFLDFVRGEESKIEAEVAHLTSRGYTVTPPADAPSSAAEAPSA